MGQINLFISIPSNRDWKPKFCTSLVNLIHRLDKCIFTGESLGNHILTKYIYKSYGNASCLSIARQKFVDEMITEGYTHWLSLDDDMSFPMDIVDRLLSWNKDIVSCNARQKTEVNKILGSCQGMDGLPVDSTGKTGLEELKTMGGAIFLAKIDSFKYIPKPHFQVMWSPEHNDYVGEDVHFAALLKVNGIQLWCDHDASQHIGHIGEYEYKFPQLNGETKCP